MLCISFQIKDIPFCRPQDSCNLSLPQMLGKAVSPFWVAGDRERNKNARKSVRHLQRNRAFQEVSILRHHVQVFWGQSFYEAYWLNICWSLSWKNYRDTIIVMNGLLELGSSKIPFCNPQRILTECCVFPWLLANLSMSWVIICLITTTCVHEYVSAKILQFYVLICSCL